MANLIQVLGASRTGTTMMHLMLGNAEDAFACGEIYAFLRPWRKHHFKPLCACDREYQDCVWRDFDKDNAAQFHADIAARFQVNWVIDESKNLRWVVDAQRWSVKNEMNVFNIVMLKQPFALMHSYYKRDFTLKRCLKMCTRYYENFLSLGLPFISVALEQLIENPAEKLEHICRAIGMCYFEGKERFWEKQHCHLFGSLGVREQMEKGKTEIRQQLEYSPEFKQLAEYELNRGNYAKRFQRVMSHLREREVTLMNDSQSVSIVSKAPIVPFWYYREWLRGAYRKHRPQYSPHQR